MYLFKFNSLPKLSVCYIILVFKSSIEPIDGESQINI